MAYCTNCGTQLEEGSQHCPFCGTPVSQAAAGSSYSYSAQQTPTKQSNDTGNMLYGVLGCCVPLVGLILFLVWKDTQPKDAKAAGIGALISVICVIAFYVLIIILGVALSVLS